MEENLLCVFEQSIWERLTKQVTLAYMDTKELFLNRSFTNYSVRSEYSCKDNESYKLRFIRIKKKNLETFNKASKEVRNNALILGYKEFKEIYDITKDMFSEKQNEFEKGRTTE